MFRRHFAVAVVAALLAACACNVPTAAGNCAVSSDCPEGATCRAGTCREGCAIDGGCQPNVNCDGGSCAHDGGACSADGDCLAAQVCQSPRCQTGTCAFDAAPDGTACDSGGGAASGSCSSGTCVPGLADGVSCTGLGNGACASGHCGCGDASCGTRRCVHLPCGSCQFSADGASCGGALASGTACDDGNVCNGADSCSTGACSQHADNACGNFVCDCGETPASCPTDCCQSQPTAGTVRGGDTPVLVRGSYDYAPSLMHDGVYRMWWCGGVAGDHILYAEADDLPGPWHAHASAVPGSYDDVFQPTGNQADFDGALTCDPSVIRVDGVYTMYYGGYPRFDTVPETTRLGVATSPDGLVWTRQNGGQPLIVPARDFLAGPNPYGAGQPSVAYVNGWYYLVYTDTTGLDGNPVNGGGVYVQRAHDALFTQSREHLSASGFVPYDAAQATAHKLADAASVDWLYSDVLDAFAMAIDGAPGAVHVRWFSADLSHELLPDTVIPGTWTEGPGLVGRPDRHVVPSATCGRVPLDVVRSVGSAAPAVGTWDLAWVGADVDTGLDCGCLDVGRVFEGSLVSSAGLPLTFVRAGSRLQLAVSAPALRLARSVYDVPNSLFSRIPYGASVSAGNAVLGASGRPAAFELDDGRLWPVSCLEAVTDNGSTITPVTTAAWDAFPLGPALYCVQ